MKKYFLALLMLFPFTACQDDDDTNAFTCTADQVGDSILLPDDSESLTIDAIYQDNRCDDLAICLVAGGIGVRLLSSANDTLLIGVGYNTVLDSTLTYNGFNLTVPDSTLTYGGFNLRLLSVTHRGVSRLSELEQSDYCAEFVWE